MTLSTLRLTSIMYRDLALSFMEFFRFIKTQEQHIKTQIKVARWNLACLVIQSNNFLIAESSAWVMSCVGQIIIRLFSCSSRKYLWSMIIVYFCCTELRTNLSQLITCQYRNYYIIVVWYLLHHRIFNRMFYIIVEHDLRVIKWEVSSLSILRYYAFCEYLLNSCNGFCRQRSHIRITYYKS